MAKKERNPVAYLDEYRGKIFEGQWPSLPQMFEITVSRFGSRNCFTEFDPDRITLTYDQVYQRVTDLARWMVENGVKKGDRIAVSGKNSPEWATVYLAALFAGAVIAPIDYGLRNEEVANLLNTAEPKFFFVDEEKYDAFPPKGKRAKYKVYSLSKKNVNGYVYDLTPKSRETPLPQTNQDDLAAILFTSGTTGNPKGVMLSHKNLVSDCLIAQTHLTLYPTDVFYALLPIHHSYTMLAVFIETISCGAEIVFAKSMAVSRMMRELKEGKITMLLGVPLLFNKLLAGIMKGIKEKGPFVYGLIKMMMGISYGIKKVFKVNPGKKMFKAILSKASLENLRIAICGGGPLASSVFKVYNQMGIDFIQGYGLTETSPIIALNPVEHFKIESVGQYFKGWMEMRIDNPDENGVGEVQVKGPMVMQGYYKMPEETAKVFTDDGWFKTGDLGKLDEEGYLSLCGRAKNMIVTEGGKNVFPEEIENAFQLYNEIEQITVVGYIADQATKSEAIEALVYVSDDLLKKLGVDRSSACKEPKVYNAVKAIVDQVNKLEQPYARISKITLLEEALEMTTTKKVKRVYNK